MSFSLTSFSPLFVEQLIAAGLELSGKTDLRFTDTLYKVDKKNQPIFITNPSLTEASSYHVTCTTDVNFHSYESCGHEAKQLPEGLEPKESLEVEGRVSALEAQIQSLLPKFSRVVDLEKRIEELERCRKTEKIDDQVVIIPRESWENLMSRVLLLETKLELSNKQLSIPLQTPVFTSSSTSDPSMEALTSQLGKISSMLKSTSDLLKNTETSDTSSK